ncbi:DUF2339 domain-containing protein [Flavobacteriales bacterium]|nr:DUF2339 domain-containing protein [Flavobacteriales bacterium]
MSFILWVLVVILFFRFRALQKQMESIQNRMDVLINEPTEPFVHEWTAPKDSPTEEPASASEPPPFVNPEPGPETSPEPEPEFSSDQPSEEPSPSAKSARGIKDLETFIGENLLSKIGILIFVIGVGFLVKLGIDTNVIKEWMRVAIGASVGAGLIAVAHRLRTSYRTFSAVLVGGALAILYFTVALAYQRYLFIEQGAAIVLMTLVTAMVFGLSLYYDRKELAVIAILGGIGTPFFVDGLFGVESTPTYLLLLNAAVLGISVRKKWPVVNRIVLFATYIICLILAQIHGSLEYDEYQFMGVMAFHFVMFFVANSIRTLSMKAPLEAGDIALLLSNAGLFFLVGSIALNPYGAQPDGMFALSLTLVHLGSFFVLRRLKSLDPNLGSLMLGLGLVFLALMAPTKLGGGSIVAYWSLQSVLLLWLARRSHIKYLRWAAIALIPLILMRLALDWTTDYFGNSSVANAASSAASFFNPAFISTAFAAVALAFLQNWITATETLSWRSLKLIWRPHYSKVLLVLVLFFGLYLELGHQLEKSFYSSPEQDLHLGAFCFLFWAGVWVTQRTAREHKSYRNAMLVVFGLGAYGYSWTLLGASIAARDQGLISKTLISNGFMVHYLSPLVLTWGGYELYKQFILRNSLRSIKGHYLIWGLALLTTIMVSIELGHATVMVGYGQRGALNYGTAIKGTLPIAWTLLAMSMMSYGMTWKLKALRLASLALFSLTIAKLFLFDLAGNSTAKIVSFILLGAILLLVSFRYQKLKFILTDDGEPLDDPDPMASHED